VPVEVEVYVHERSLQELTAIVKFSMGFPTAHGWVAEFWHPFQGLQEYGENI